MPLEGQLCNVKLVYWLKLTWAPYALRPLTIALIDGKGPTNYDEATGDGYGGGGQGVTYDDDGLEGVILLEVESV